MAISLMIHESVGGTLYTDTDGDGKVDIYSTDSYAVSTGSFDSNVLHVSFNYSGGADLSSWVVSDSNGLYNLSTSPISGVSSVQFHSAYTGAGSYVSDASWSGAYSSVTDVYYTIETDQHDAFESTITTDFSVNTVTASLYGGGQFFGNFYGAGSNGGADGYYDTYTHETQGSGSFYSDDEVTYANNGPSGYGYYDSTTGTGIYAGNGSQPLEYSEYSDGSAGSGWYTQNSGPDPILIPVETAVFESGSFPMLYSVIEDGWANYYPSIAGSGEYFGNGSTSPSLDYAGSGYYGSGWYTSVGSYGSGSYGGYGSGSYAPEYNDSGSGSSGYFTSIDGSGSYYGTSSPDKAWGSTGDGYYVDTGSDGYGTGSFMGYYGRYYFEDSGPSGSGYYAEVAFGSYLGYMHPDYYDYGYYGSGWYADSGSGSYGSGSFMAGSAGEYPYPTRAQDGPMGEGYYEEVYGSGYSFGSSYPTMEYSTEGFNGSGPGWYYEENPYGAGSPAGCVVSGSRSTTVVLPNNSSRFSSCAC
ncbi:hypothetical protein N9U60_03935 [Betaproteobacteria bacterium]|nr:hypothetical protein [Betaproteobacteria bacterium]